MDKMVAPECQNICKQAHSAFITGFLRIATSAILLEVSFPSWIGSGEEMSAFGLCEI